MAVKKKETKETKVNTAPVEVRVKEVDDKVALALKALDDFASFDQEKIDYIVAKCTVAALDQHGTLAKAAVDETGRGVFEDKATKNLFACEYMVNYLRDLKTVGIISEDPVTGITEVAEPVGVVAGLTPVTNPTSTAIFKSLLALKTRNPIIFAFHPNAQKCSAEAARIVYEAALKAGAPENCIQWIEHPSMDATSALMNHPGVSTILATGGNAMVKAAYSCGKPALGVGAGNAPAYIETTADIKQAVNDIAMSKAFDNGMICASEQTVIVDENIYEDVKAEFKHYNVHFCSPKEKKLLEFDNITSAEAIKRKQVYYQNMLSAVEKGTKAEYELKLKSINSAYQLELLEAQKQVMNEEEKAELLNSITEKFYQQQLDAQKEFKNKMIDDQAKEIKERFEAEILKTDLNGNNDFSERLGILELELQQRQELLNNAQQREGESIEEFNLRKLHLAKDAKDKENEISSEIIGHRMQELESLRNVVGGVSDVIEAFGVKNKALAQASKMVALAEIAINTGVAISSGIKASVGVPFPKNLIAIATTISQVLSGVATAIRTVKSAKFATGGLVTGSGSGTSDSIPAQLSNGESVLTANATSMFAPALSAFNQIGGGVPIVNNGNSQQQIGEEFLARAVARGMASAPRPIVSVEEISKASNRVETIERLSTLN